MQPEDIQVGDILKFENITSVGIFIVDDIEYWCTHSEPRVKLKLLKLDGVAIRTVNQHGYNTFSKPGDVYYVFLDEDDYYADQHDRPRSPIILLNRCTKEYELERSVPLKPTAVTSISVTGNTLEATLDSGETLSVEIPKQFKIGQHVKDKFGNIYEVTDAEGDLYTIKLIKKIERFTPRVVDMFFTFRYEGDEFTINATPQEAKEFGGEIYTNQIFATELELLEAVDYGDVKPSNYKSLEEIRDLTRLNDVKSLIEEIYTEISNQASKGSNSLTLEGSKYSNCIDFLKSEGFEVTRNLKGITIKW